MPTYMEMLAKAAKKVTAPYPSGPTKAPAPPAPDRPTQIPGQVYKGLNDFTAWQPFGERSKHSRFNLDYIPMKDRFVKQNNYPVELQKLIDFAWKLTVADPRNVDKRNEERRANNQADLVTRARGTEGAFVMGTKGRNPAHVNVNLPGAPSALRTGLNMGARGSGAMVNTWSDMKLFEQVAAYTFRGDQRSPEKIMAAGGFYPPSMRTDDFYKGKIAAEFYSYMNRKQGLTLDPAAQIEFKKQIAIYMSGKGEDGKHFAEYHMWRQILSGESMHLTTMSNEPFLKAYISTTREVQIARDAANGSMGHGANDTAGLSPIDMTGWLYALRIKSGFLLKTGVAGIVKQEGEISHLGHLPWKNVYGFRSVFDKSAVYLRSGFESKDHEAFRQVLASLSRA